MATATTSWWENELAGCSFADARLGQRLHKLIERMGGAIGASLPLACQDWASTKAAYRFLSNDRVSEEDILIGHFRATRDRAAAAEGPILVLQDTMEFSYQREHPEAIGITCSVNSGKDKAGRSRTHTVCGFLMHASLAVTTDGLPLGLLAAKFWSRQKFKGTTALKRKINPTRIPIEQKESIRWLENMRQSTERLGEPARCVHIGDRESDIYELFCTAQDLGTHFLVRTCVDRLAGDGRHTVADDMQQTRLKGVYRIEVCDNKGHHETALLELRYRRIRVLPPIGKQKRYPALTLTIIHATERGTLVDRPAIEWKLITDLPVTTRAAALEKLRWYAQHWKIEVFHKILKSGCRVEEARLRTAERLVRLVAVFCIVGWRVFWLTMMQRAAPDAAATLVFTSLKIRLLDRLMPSKTPTSPGAGTLSVYLTKLAQLGGYLARNKDRPLGNTVIWRGLSRLTNIKLGATLTRASHRCG